MAPDVQLTRYAMPQQVKYRNKIEIWNSINFQHMFIHIYCQHMWLFTFITIINKNTLMSGHQSGNKSETVSGHTHTHIGRGRGTAISMHTFYTHANRNNMEFELSAQCGCCSLFVCLLVLVTCIKSFAWYLPFSPQQQIVFHTKSLALFRWHSSRYFLLMLHYTLPYQCQFETIKLR